MVPSSNPGEGRNYFYSQVGNGGLSVTHIDGYVVAIMNYVLEKVAPFTGPVRRTEECSKVRKTGVDAVHESCLQRSIMKNCDL